MLGRRKIKMNELIKVTVQNDQQLVSARELHKGLKLRKQFTDWVKQNFKEFEDGEDFVFTPGSVNMPNGGTKQIQDYALTRHGKATLHDESYRVGA